MFNFTFFFFMQWCLDSWVPFVLWALIIQNIKTKMLFIRNYTPASIVTFSLYVTVLPKLIFSEIAYFCSTLITNRHQLIFQVSCCTVRRDREDFPPSHPKLMLVQYANERHFPQRVCAPGGAAVMSRLVTPANTAQEEPTRWTCFMHPRKFTAGKKKRKVKLFPTPGDKPSKVLIHRQLEWLRSFRSLQWVLNFLADKSVQSWRI